MKQKKISKPLILFFLIIGLTLIITVPVNAKDEQLTQTMIKTTVTKEWAVDYLKVKGLFQGDDTGNLMLDEGFTREQLMVIISRLLGKETEAQNFSVENITFQDVPKSSWAAPYIQWAKVNKITQGYSNQQFGLGDKLTSWQASLAFGRVLGYDNLSDYEMIQKLNELNLTNNMSINNSEGITRRDVALLLYNTLYTKCSDGKYLVDKLGLNKNVPKGNTSGNICNRGLITEQDDWIYYVDQLDKNHIYKIKKDRSIRIRINEVPSYYINILGEWIYYANGSDNYNIYKIDVDGKENIKLNNQPSQFITVVGSWIYYIDSNTFNLYKINTDGTNNELVSLGTCSHINIQDDWIYYTWTTDNAKIYKMRIDGLEKEKVCDEQGVIFSVIDDWIYYVNTEKDNEQQFKPFRIKVDGSSEEQLADERVTYFNIVNGKIYYTTEKANMQMNLDGSNKTEIDMNKVPLINREIGFCSVGIN